MADKTVRPPYTSYRSFETLISELREHAVMPAVIDRSFLSKRSGSEQSALIATLKFFDLVDDQQVPTHLLHEYVKADEEEGKAILKAMMERSYTFIMDGSFNLKNATSSQMAAKFRECEVSGSTLAKAIAFFLSAAKTAGIVVSLHVKAPSSSSNGSTKKRQVKAPPAPEAPIAPVADHNKPATGMIHIPIPIWGMPDGSIHLPEGLNERQWSKVIELTQFILKNYRADVEEENLI